MKILVVDDDPAIVEYLSTLLANSTGHQIYTANGGEEAIRVARGAEGVHLLLTDVVMEGMDGFVLRENMLATYPTLQSMFVSGYDLSDYVEQLRGDKIFNKPLNGNDIVEAVAKCEENLVSEAREAAATQPAAPGRSLTANLTHLMQRQGFTGKLDQFQLVDIIQMCCISRRSGRLRVSKGVEKGVLFLNHGNIIHAVSGGVEGEGAVFRIIGWEFGEFYFDEGIAAPKESIKSGWEHVIMEGVRRRDESLAGAAEPDADTGLIGKTVGDYRVVRRLGEGRWGDAFEAQQITVQRPVALKVLRSEYLLDPEAVQRFIADASAKANVQHPSIVAVYEAGESNGVYFYAREYIDGHTLGDLIAQGTSLGDQQALSLMRVVSEALSYLNHYKIPHDELNANKIFFDAENRPRLANLAIVGGEKIVDVQKEIKNLSGIVSATMQGGASASPDVRALLTKMKTEGNGGFLSWGALIQTIRALEPKIVPADAYKLSEQDEAAIRAVESEKRRQKRAAYLSTAGMVALIWVLFTVIYFRFFHNKGVRDFNEMAEIPAGEFDYQGGKKELPAFNISKYEVSIGMYRKFLEALEEMPPNDRGQFDHPKQPKGKLHKPHNWDLMQKAAASKRVTMQGAHIDLNTPVFNIDWYDAFAYAKWRGHRLPSEEEWEKAARGPAGLLYPWGNEFDPKKCNSAADYNPNPTVVGQVDGYNRWAPVDAHPGDKSPFGVFNMAANVAEWTGTWAPNPTNPNEVLPVIRGGSFNSDDYSLTRRIIFLLPEDNQNPYLGFRTATDATGAAQ